jgi:hypothetical protein
VSERDELHRLVEKIPDEQVPAVLADVRRRLTPVRRGSWPPVWFGSFSDERTDLGARHDDLLAEGFGR